MIQRIQSAYLFVVLILIILMFFFPFVSFIDQSGKFYHLAYKGILLYSKSGWILFQTNYLVAVLLVVIFFVTLICIFLYSNRFVQLRICLYLIIGLILLLLCIFIEYEVTIAKNHFLHSNFSFASLLPIISLIIVYLAYKAIKKDDNLVKSVDRLR